MNIVCQAPDLISYMLSAISTFRNRMPQISDADLDTLKQAIEYQHQLLLGKSPRANSSQPMTEMSLNELFSVVVRCVDCGQTLAQALSARAYDTMHN
ncbi:MAG: hypothetical protein Q7V63_02020 [Gammaproteobacteria bacterium]|nr:hypothetical protein [Gammaproteobacteria bacterium]